MTINRILTVILASICIMGCAPAGSPQQKAQVKDDNALVDAVDAVADGLRNVAGAVNDAVYRK